MNIKQIAISGIAMLLLDFIYLSTFSDFFNNVVKAVQGYKIKFNPVGAILCYILLIFGLNYFIIDKKKSLTDAFLFGIVVYGVYETTTYAILKNWKLSSVVLDTLWGGILFGIVTAIFYQYKK